MRFKSVGSAVAITAALALSACGEDQTAQAPPPPQQDQAAQMQPTEPQPAPPPPVAEAPGATAQGEVIVTDPGPPPGTPMEQTGALPAPSEEPIPPGQYQSADLVLELGPEGNFRMVGADGREIEGRYNLFGDTMTLSGVTDAPPDAPFPMTCQIVPEGQGFRVVADAQSCAPLDGQVFEPAG